LRRCGRLAGFGDMPRCPTRASPLSHPVGIEVKDDCSRLADLFFFQSHTWIAEYRAHVASFDTNLANQSKARGRLWTLPTRGKWAIDLVHQLARFVRAVRMKQDGSGTRPRGGCGGWMFVAGRRRLPEETWKRGGGGNWAGRRWETHWFCCRRWGAIDHGAWFSSRHQDPRHGGEPASV